MHEDIGAFAFLLDEAVGILEVGREVEGLMVDGGDVQVLYVLGDSRLKVLALHRRYHGLYAVPCIAEAVLWRVLGFCAASILLR